MDESEFPQLATFTPYIGPLGVWGWAGAGRGEEVGGEIGRAFVPLYALASLKHSHPHDHACGEADATPRCPKPPRPDHRHGHNQDRPLVAGSAIQTCHPPPSR